MNGREWVAYKKEKVRIFVDRFAVSFSKILTAVNLGDALL